jgi:hypothetical protein
MQTLVDVIKTTARIAVGSILLCIGIALILSTCKGLSSLPPNAGIAEWSADATAFVLSLIFGVVGWKMLTRRSLPAKSA